MVNFISSSWGKQSDSFLPNSLHIPDHENGTGTNIYEALNSVYIMMNNQMQRLGMNTVAWQEIRHVIILLTDGECAHLCGGWRCRRRTTMGPGAQHSGSLSATLSLCFLLIK